MTDSAMPAPPASPETTTFTEAAAAGNLLIRRCTACARAHWYPRATCPFCAGETIWETASGDATLYAFSTMVRVDPPYTLAYVRLAEGPVMMTNIVDADPATLAIGQPVRVAFRPAADGTPVPCFTAA